MIPRKKFGETVDSVKKTEAQEFSNLMPRPGWKEYLGLWLFDL